MSEKRKFASPSAIQLQNRGKTIGTVEKLSVIMRREEGKQMVDICRNVTLAYGVIYKYMHMLCTNVYILYTRLLYTLQVRMSTNGIVIHCIG
jgi:hypothetical protein